jgi:hypothetical protein
MDQPQARRCAIWVDTTTLMAAQELANCAGVDVDAFIEFVVKELHEQRCAKARFEPALRSQGPRPSSRSTGSGGDVEVGLAEL